MDQQVRYGRAWLVPYAVGREAGGFAFRHYRALTLARTKAIFRRYKLHRFSARMVGFFHAAVQRIDAEYDGDAPAHLAWAPQRGGSHAALSRRSTFRRTRA